MTTGAHREVVAAKRALPVMTTHATESTRGRVVIEWLRRGYFIRLKPTAQAMAIVAAQAFVAIVLRVTEAELECTRCLVGAHWLAGLVTHTARRNVAIA